MASSSSSPRTWKYRVFTSFHGPDVRKNFLGHLRKQFNNNGISMFDDQKIERGQTIALALTQAIQESRISIVVLSKNYASSSWCLDELVDILKCDKQIVIPIFYGVDPRDVRYQTGDFGKAFEETCARRAETERQKWSEALNAVGHIAGQHLLNWDDEAEMIKEIARDVSNKLNATISWDFEDMVGIEAHLKKMKSLLHLDYLDGAMIVGICGPAGIGKTTIARALHSRLSDNFDRTCFMGNLKGSYNSHLDEYGLKLCLQKKLLTEILNENDTRVDHLGAIQNRLHDQKVLIILDDVDDMMQLEAMAKETKWFGPGSRIILTTEDQDLLKKHDINNTYHVDFPSEEEAHKILCTNAFRQSLAPEGFEKLVASVTKLCCRLPLGLRIAGSSLRTKNKEEWEVILHRLEDRVNPKIEGVLSIGYESLHENDQLLFLLIAFFFNYEDCDHVMAMLPGNNPDVRFGLKNLVQKSLIQISSKGNIVMHKLLQQVGREVVERQEPRKRQVLIDTDDICDVLENDTGSRRVTGISLDISKIKDDVYISAGAFKKMHNLQFIKIYKTRFDNDIKLHVPEDMVFPRHTRSLHWELYPENSLPRTFRPEYLVELNLQQNRLKKLWEGIQPLPNLKKMNLLSSFSLEELPDLSNATNLERLDLTSCLSLVKIPSSIGNLDKLECLTMRLCIMLRVVPADINLASLKEVHMEGCRRLTKIPDFSSNVTSLSIPDTVLQEFPESVRLWSHLESLYIYGSAINVSLFGKTPLGKIGADIERIPDWIKDFHRLHRLVIYGCPKLASLPELPASLRGLAVEDCESLQTLSFSFDSPIEYIYFPNCFKLGEDAWRVAIQQSLQTCVPGSKIPQEFDHRATGNSLTVRMDSYRFRICVVLSPKPQMGKESPMLWFRVRINGRPTDHYMEMSMGGIQTEHLCIFDFNLLYQYGWLDQDKETLLEFEFNTTPRYVDVIKCGLQILTDETDRSKR